MSSHFFEDLGGNGYGNGSYVPLYSSQGHAWSTYDKESYSYSHMTYASWLCMSEQKSEEEEYSSREGEEHNSREEDGSDDDAKVLEYERCER